jgi:tetratricopeptide (TPR) repeat protein
MNQTYTCPNGHQWEDMWGEHSVAPDQTIACPVCGARTQVPGLNSGDPGVTKQLPPDTPVHLGPTGAPQTLEFRGPPSFAVPPVEGYELLAELGRGGMGVVYKARHKALKRTVALKMVLGGQNERSLTRFQTEAEAVARLQHPNIVQIYEVGQSNGMPYFAMEFVEGCNLTAKLAGTPQPAKECARLVATLARAMHYAHEHGIVHRDLKPGNILLGGTPPASGGRQPASGGRKSPGDSTLGTPKITDFGLAKKLDDASGPTRTGDVMGTPSYMAPEQAMGRLDHIGPATDVYALGAILYELLTARPPFKAETAMDTMFQVMYTDPVRPGRLRAKMPQDLETVCLKCLEKEAARRYPTALALAEDLDHFINDEPIQARPVGPVGLALRWARRRPAAAALVGVSALAFVAALAGSLLYNFKQDQWNSQEKQLNQRLALLADSEKQKADEALRERQNAETARDKAVNLQKLAEERRLQAERNFQKARQAVEEMLNEVGNTRLENVPYMDAVRRTLLSRAVDFHRSFLEADSADPSIRFQAAQAYVQLGNIYRKLGTERSDRVEAEKAYGEAIKLLDKLRSQSPDHPAYGQALADAYFHDAQLLRELDRLSDAEAANRQALKIQEGLAGAYPKEPAYRHARSQTLNELGMIARKRGQAKAAEQAYEAALAIQEALTKEFPDQRIYEEKLAGSRNDLGALYASIGRPEKAAEAYDRSRRLFEKLSKQYPEVAAYRRGRAATTGNLGLALRDLDQATEAERKLQAALPLWQELAADYPATLSYRQELANTHNNLAAVMALDARRLADAATEYGEAVATLEKLVADFATVPGFRSSLAAMLDNLAGVLARQGKSVAARAQFERAEALHLAVTKEKPDNDPFRRRLRTHYIALAEALLRPGENGEKPRYAEAAQAAEQLPKLKADDPGEYVRAAMLVAQCVPAARKDGGAAAADKYARRAVQLLEEAVQHGYQDADALKNNTALKTVGKRDDFKSLVEGLENKKK